ncbi:reprolysin-like metallopeptidase [Granulosicoccus antarcticus]|nr:zinc-dependent metalloprotease family protein [Granulosicoccus antarcticus]
MTTVVRRLLLPCTMVMLTSIGAAHAATSPDGVWESAAQLQVSAAENGSSNTNVQPTEYSAFSLNKDLLESTLATASGEQIEGSSGASGQTLIVHLPMPDGSFMAFNVVESSIMEPDLAAQFPEIKTYAGTSVEDAAIQVRLDLTPAGFHAQVMMVGQRWYIDPLFKDNSELYASYYRENLDGEVQQCLVGSANESSPVSTSAQASGDKLRTYRIAVATTGEYGLFHGGTVSQTMSAVVTTINRVNGIYQRELAIGFTLVAGNSQLIFVDPTTDPFTGNFNGDTLMEESQTVIDARIGSAGYDIGHTFSTGAGGVAGLGVVCTEGTKGQGVTGGPSPVGDAYDVDFVAHEIGHQFGGNHTFNSGLGSCEGNRNASTAYEPGGGTTIQAYAGICESNDLQQNSDAIFHSESFREIRAYMANPGGGGACGVETILNNATPTANAGADYTIPRATPFVLTGSGADSNAGDVLSYLWEQRSLGPKAALSAPDDGAIPLFRVFTPSESPTRFLPRLSTLVTNVPSSAEKLPNLARTMNWRLTVRDNKGGVQSEDAAITVNAGAGPFTVTSPNGGENLQGLVNVTWDVANTDTAPVNATLVDIFLSVDGGLTFDLSNPLVTGTPNDGSYDLTLPSQTQSQARIMVKGHNNIFFDISNGNFSFTPHDVGKVIATNTWQQISLPAVAPAGSNTVAAIIADDMTGTHQVDWMLFGYDPVTEMYTEPALTEVMATGIGYWIIQVSGSDKILDMPAGSTPLSTSASAGDPRCSDAEGCFRLSLTTTAGTFLWNMIGNPFYQTPSVSSIRVSTTGGICGDTDGCSMTEAANEAGANVQHNQFWTYNGTTYDIAGESNTLSPWTGYWNPVLSGAHGLSPVMHMPRH